MGERNAYLVVTEVRIDREKTSEGWRQGKQPGTGSVRHAGLRNEQGRAREVEMCGGHGMDTGTVEAMKHKSRGRACSYDRRIVSVNVVRNKNGRS